MKKKLKIIRPPTLIPYRGYGNEHELVVMGHVLENRPEFLADESDKKRKNFRNMIGRYLSTSIPDEPVFISFHDHHIQTKTDEYGYFKAHLDIANDKTYTGWQNISYNLPELNQTIHGEVYFPPQKAEFGIISDIDDTILISHSNRLIKKLRVILTKNAKTRLPFAGVREFYQTLTEKGNPIFYVSSSEWNLHDFLVDFFETQQLPKGPFLLQDLKSGISDLIQSGGGDHQHKYEKAHAIMQTYPHLKFILIGDSGQRDPEIYERVAKEYPDRVKAVYIRQIGKNHSLQKFDYPEKVPVLLVENTTAALEHAHKSGILHTEPKS